MPMALTPASLSVDYGGPGQNLTFIGGAVPRFSWQFQTFGDGVSGRRGVSQTGYQVQVARSDSAVVWDSGQVASNRTLHVPYGGPPLTADARYQWRVQ